MLMVFTLPQKTSPKMIYSIKAPFGDLEHSEEEDGDRR
jgi:hypothetical protein